MKSLSSLWRLAFFYFLSIGILYLRFIHVVCNDSSYLFVAEEYSVVGRYHNLENTWDIFGCWYYV